MKRFECRAVVFDLDGVLVDSTGYVEQQWRRWATSKGLAVETFLKVCHGRRALDIIRLAAPHLDADAEVAAFAPEAGTADPVLGPVEGAACLLQALPVGSWAVATSGTRAVATDRLRRADLPLPGVLICAEDVVRGKPFPDAYLLAAAGLGVAPTECLVVEDAPAGIEAARAAGMPVIALTTTHRCEELPADACIASLAGIHVGRIADNARRARMLEIMVLD